jgi:hypothetical protein
MAGLQKGTSWFLQVNYTFITPAADFRQARKTPGSKPGKDLPAAGQPAGGVDNNIDAILACRREKSPPILIMGATAP